MKKKRKNYTKAKNLSFNNPRDKFERDRFSYQTYQRKQYGESSINENTRYHFTSFDVRRT